MKAILLKNLWLTLADKKGLFIDLALPIILATIFGVAFGGNGDSAPKMELVIADEDGGKEVAALIERLKSSDALEIELKDAASARELVRKGKRPFALIIPKGSDERLAHSPFGVAPEFTLLVDPAQETRAPMLKGLLFSAVMQNVGPNFTSPTLGMETLEKAIKDLDADPSLSPADKLKTKFFLEAGLKFFELMPKPEEGKVDVGKRVSEPIVFKSETLSSDAPKINAFAHTIPATAVMFALFAVMGSALVLVRERNRGTLSRLIIAPIGRAKVLAAEALSIFLFIVFQLAVMLAFGMVVFHLRILGPAPACYVGLVAITVATAACATGFCMLIAGYGKTEKQIHGYSTLVILTMSALGGSMMPLWLAPKWIQMAANFTITRWAVDGFEDLTLRGLPLLDVLPKVGVLMGVAAILTWLGVRAFKWE